MSVLKPCGCGGEAELGTDFGRDAINCTECYISIRSDEVCSSKAGIADLIETWNKAMSTPNIDKAQEYNIDKVKSELNSMIFCLDRSGNQPWEGEHLSKKIKHLLSLLEAQ